MVARSSSSNVGGFLARVKGGFAYLRVRLSKVKKTAASYLRAPLREVDRRELGHAHQTLTHSCAVL